jgi:hypothetical protein
MSGLHEVQSGSGRLAGKVAIITGAASGFGLACAKKFVAEGAKVVAADMNESALSNHFAQDSAHVAAITANVTSASDWAKMVETAESKFGGVDILINNAGTSYKNKPTLTVTEEEFDKVFAVNVKSIYLSVPAVVPALQKRGGGSIINIASIGAMRPRPGLVWYNASKGAVANVCCVPPLPLIPFAIAIAIGWLVLIHGFCNRQRKVSQRNSARNRFGSTQYVPCYRELVSSNNSSGYPTPKKTCRNSCSMFPLGD